MVEIELGLINRFEMVNKIEMVNKSEIGIFKND